MITDRTYYIGDIDIPQGSRTELNTNLDESISLNEPIILKKLLGYTLYTEMMTAYNAYVTALASYDPDAEPAEELPVLAEKWDKLINGDDLVFTFNGVEYANKWIGLKNVDKISLISYFVYYRHRRAFDTYFNGSNEVRSKSENSTAINTNTKLVSAYNKMVDLYGETPSGYFDYIHYNNKPSAFNYLVANKATYPTWIYEPVVKINAWNF